MASRRPGLTSLLLLLLVGTSSLGHWCAVTGLPELGLVAAAELGADLDHLVIIPNPGCEGRWQSVVATLLETVDLVCLAPDTPVRPVDARRLAARAREHCSTLLVLDACTPTGVARGFLFGGPARPGRAMARWPGPSDLRCAVRGRTGPGSSVVTVCSAPASSRLKSAVGVPPADLDEACCASRREVSGAPGPHPCRLVPRLASRCCRARRPPGRRPRRQPGHRLVCPCPGGRGASRAAAQGGPGVLSGARRGGRGAGSGCGGSSSP